VLEEVSNPATLRSTLGMSGKHIPGSSFLDLMKSARSS
jgi:hypothetical protein